MAARELKSVPVNEDILDHINNGLRIFEDELNNVLIILKNRDYGDSWQAEGPFLAASRMKDKITRVSNLIYTPGVKQETNAEGFQDILEMMAYGKLLLAYWVWNDFGLPQDSPGCVHDLYSELAARFGEYTKIESEDLQRTQTAV